MRDSRMMRRRVFLRSLAACSALVPVAAVAGAIPPVPVQTAEVPTAAAEGLTLEKFNRAVELLREWGASMKEDQIVIRFHSEREFADFAYRRHRRVINSPIADALLGGTDA